MLKSKNQINILNLKDEDLSAGNQILSKKVGTSETIRALTKKQKEWLAGVIDGDGNFDLRILNNKKVLKAIRIVQDLRDINLLYHVKDFIKGGRIIKHTKNTMVYIVSNQQLMSFIINAINGYIRIKIIGFLEACKSLNIKYIQSNYNIPYNSSYFAGLVDTDGSFVFNYPCNRIDLFLEFKQTEYTTKLNFNNVISDVTCKVYKLIKRNQTKNKIFYSIRFDFSGISQMLSIYNFFKYHRLYSSFKFFRVMQIKQFLKIRMFKNSSLDSLEFKIYNQFLVRFFKYKNEHKELPSFIKKDPLK